MAEKTIIFFIVVFLNLGWICCCPPTRENDAIIAQCILNVQGGLSKKSKKTHNLQIYWFINQFSQTIANPTYEYMRLDQRDDKKIQKIFCVFCLKTKNRSAEEDASVLSNNNIRKTICRVRTAMTENLKKIFAPRGAPLLRQRTEALKKTLRF